jgi:DNA-binding transcriptional MerR regulator
MEVAIPAPIMAKVAYFSRISAAYNGNLGLRLLHLEPDNMPYKEKEIEKQYYTIGEVAAIFDVAPSLIRFWETEFEQLKPKKSKKGNRQYTPKDIEELRTVYHLVKERGFTIQGAREVLKNKSVQTKEKIEIINSLEKVRSFLVGIKDQLNTKS